MMDFWVLVNVILTSQIYLLHCLHLCSTKEIEIERSPLEATESLPRNTAERSKGYLLVLKLEAKWKSVG